MLRVAIQLALSLGLALGLVGVTATAIHGQQQYGGPTPDPGRSTEAGALPSRVPDGSDLEILAVTGVVEEDGTVVLEPLRRFPSGELDPVAAGDDLVRLLDTGGRVVAEARFASQVALAEATDSPSVGLLISRVLYPPDALWLEIVRAGQVLARISITTRLLQDSIAAIPDHGFVDSPATRRQALNDQVTVLDQKITAGDLLGARDYLRDQIRPALVAGLLGSYPIEAPEEYTKAQVLDNLDALLLRLAQGVPTPAPTATPTPPTARTRGSDGVPVILVSGTIDVNSGAVTIDGIYQGANGTVTAFTPGDGTYRLLDARGLLLQDISFRIAGTQVWAEGDPEPQTLSRQYLSSQLPDRPDAFWLDILRAGQPLAHISLPGALLRTAVLSIPDGGFVSAPATRRQALLDGVTTLEQQLTAGDLAAARAQLTNTIRPQLVDGLLDSYPTELPSQFTKAESLALVDVLIQRVDGASGTPTPTPPVSARPTATPTPTSPGTIGSDGVPIVLVTGTIEVASGTVTINGLRRLPNGTVDPSIPGDGTYRLLDARGMSLQDISFPIAATQVLAEGDPQPLTLDRQYLISNLPDRPDAFWLDILRAGHPLAHISLPGALLRTAVLSLPDAGFVAAPATRRQALLDGVTTLEQQLTAGELPAARAQLANTIRPQLVDGLLDSYPTELPASSPRPRAWPWWTCSSSAWTGRAAPRCRHRWSRPPRPPVGPRRYSAISICVTFSATGRLMTQ